MVYAGMLFIWIGGIFFGVTIADDYFLDKLYKCESQGYLQYDDKEYQCKLIIKGVEK